MTLRRHCTSVPEIRPESLKQKTKHDPASYIKAMADAMEVGSEEGQLTVYCIYVMHEGGKADSPYGQKWLFWKSQK